LLDDRPEQMDSYISANLASAAPAVASLREEHEREAAKNKAASEAAKELAEEAEAKAQAEEAELASQIAAEEAKAAAPAAVAPAQWEELRTDAGDSYYHNAITQETTWERPTGAVIAPVVAPTMAATAATAVVVEKCKSKLWALLGDGGGFEDMIESNTDETGE